MKRTGSGSMAMDSNKAGRLPVIVLLALLLFPAACTSMSGGDPGQGKRWFTLYRCSGCHGQDGQGGRAPVLAATSLSFNTFLSKLRSPDSFAMPAYAPDRLSQQDAADIYAWLTSSLSSN